MTQGEIIAVLKHQAGIHPKVSCYVWGEMERSNEAVFRAYEIRLRLKDQIATFNTLVRQQKIFVAQAQAQAGGAATKGKLYAK